MPCCRPGMLLALFCVLLLSGCLSSVSLPDAKEPRAQGTIAPPAESWNPAHNETPPSSTARDHTVKIPFRDQIVPSVYELPSGALATWRQYSDRKPALILFSNHPFLAPLREGEETSTREFVQSAPTVELVRRGKMLVADPVLTSPQTLSAAIEADLLAELIFVQPLKAGIDKLSLAEFQQNAFNAGFITAEEAHALTLTDGVISGRVRGLPFRCVHPEALPAIKDPVLVHIDLGYFENLYVNAIKTPAYPLLYQLIAAIRSANWPTLAFTLSYSNQETEYSLESRFMISTLADTLYHPALLDGGIPASWQLRANAQYAADMFAETQSQDLLVEATESSPDDPAAFYDLSLALFRQKISDAAFTALDRAVALDPGYALAYVELYETGMKLGEWEKSLKLLKKAASALPENPFIRISQADLLIKQGRGSAVLPLLHELKKLPWSSLYHPGIPNLLDEMIEVATLPDAK